MSRKKALNNPNGANQWVADPRQQLFLAYYLDPQSPTFANALQSGLKAGFSQEYSENILAKMPAWLSERVGSSPMLVKAEKNLSEFLDLPNETQAMSMFGPVFEKVETTVVKKGKKVKKMVDDRTKPVMKLNPEVMKIKSDISKFVAERAGRIKWGSKEPADAPPVNIFIFGNEQLQRVAARVLGGRGHGNTAGA